MSETYVGVSERKWQQRSQEDRLASFLSAQLNVPITIAQLLAGRNINSVEEAQQFLMPSLQKSMIDPFILKDMDKAIHIAVDAIEKKKRIAIFGDYDVDGATSTSLLKKFFNAIGQKVTVYIPDRIEEGYGPNIKAIQSLVDQGHSVLITVDCGTTAFDVFEFTKSMELEVIVLDHHKAEAKLPSVDALVNPCRLDVPTPELQNLAAVGISFMFIVALNKILREKGFYKKNPAPDLRLLLDIVALGTVADVVKLTGLNRVFVAQGLKVLRKRLNTGLNALCDIAGIDQPPDSYHLGFVLGPRINAGGRVGKADFGTKLLATQDTQEAREIAMQLNSYNQERQEIEAAVLEAAVQQVEDNKLYLNSCIVVGGQEWHAGVIGIVSSRLKEKYQKPVAVIAYDNNGMGKASGRSIEGVDFGSLIHQALHKNFLINGGGHAMAVGFSIEKKQQEIFYQFLEAHMKKACGENGLIYKYDLELSLDGITLDFVNSIEQLAPFGMGNPMPKFRFRQAHLSFASIVGKDHVRCRFTKNEKGYIDAIAFRCADSPLGKRLLCSQNKAIDIIGTVRKETWMGSEKTKIFLEDIISSDEKEV